MNTPVPPIPPSNILLQTLTAPSGTTGTIIQSALPQNAAQVGQVILGTVINRSADGQFLIQTNTGQLTIQTAANLQNGRIVSLQVQNIGAQPQVLVIPLPAKDRGAQSTTGNGQPIITSTLTEGSTVAATVTRPTTTTATSSSQMNASHSVSAPSAADTIGATTNSTATAARTNTASPRITDGSSVSPMPSLKPVTKIPQPSLTLSGGTTFNVKILSVTPPLGSPGAQTSPPLGSDTLLGTVTGTKPSGHTVVHTNQGEIVLDSHTVLPRGTQLRMQLVSTPLPLMEGADEFSPLLSQQWDALRHAILTLQASDPSVARNITQRVLPQASGPLTTGILFFLSAMMTGDLRRWMGEDAMRILQRTGGNLLERLGRDIGEMQRLASEPSGQEWRSYLIPILVGSDLQQLKMFVRGEKEHDEQDESDKNRDTRFIIEVEFSALGPFQFDGLTREKNIELMIRTRDTLAGNIRDDIRAIFSNTTSALGFNGTLNFQQTLTFEVNPTKEVNERRRGLTV